MADTINLAGFSNTQNLTISNVLLENFVMRYDWGFVDKGGFFNNKLASSGIYGGDRSKLYSLKDPNYTEGKIWQSNRENWVWETGTSVGTPISPTGIFINNTYYPNDGTTYKINYKEGKIVLNTAISTSSNVKLEYSSKYINVQAAQGIPWIRNIQRLSNRSDDPQLSYRGSGEWATLGQTRVQLPALLIDVSPIQSTRPAQLGGGKWVHNHITYYIITEYEWQAKNIMDHIAGQDETVINLFNPNDAMRSGVYPFDASNFLRGNATASGMYPQLVQNFKYKDCYIFDTGRSELTQLNPNLYFGTIKCKTEVRDI